MSREQEVRISWHEHRGFLEQVARTPFGIGMSQVRQLPGQSFKSLVNSIDVGDVNADWPSRKDPSGYDTS
jgi:hypothetical protein